MGSACTSGRESKRPQYDNEIFSAFPIFPILAKKIGFFFCEKKVNTVQLNKILVVSSIQGIHGELPAAWRCPKVHRGVERAFIYQLSHEAFNLNPRSPPRQTRRQIFHGSVTEGSTVYFRPIT